MDPVQCKAEFRVEKNALRSVMLRHSWSPTPHIKLDQWKLKHRRYKCNRSYRVDFFELRAFLWICWLAACASVFFCLRDVHCRISPQKTFDSKLQKGPSLCVVRKKSVNQKKDLKLCNKLRRCRHYVKTVKMASPTWRRRQVAISYSVSVHDRNRKFASGMPSSWLPSWCLRSLI